MDEVGLGEQLQRARKTAGLTQQELCHKAKLSYSTLAKIERGAIKSPSIFTIQHIAAALDMDLSRLMGENSSVKKTKKKSANGVEFVYFDINGCLVRFFQRAFIGLSNDCGVSADLIERVFWHYNDAACKGDITMMEFNHKMASKLGIESLDWQAYYMGAIEPIPEFIELLITTSAEYKVGLFSNIMPGFIDEMISKSIIPSLDYETIVDSSIVKANKPDKKAYDFAFKMAGVDPGGILLIDDSRANIVAAEQYGWHVVWADQYHPSETVNRITTLLT